MATQVDIGWDPSSFTLVDEGVYKVAIFNVEKDSNTKGEYFKLTERINGGDFDGEDLMERFVGLYGNTLFRIHEILTALGEIDKYYTAGENGKGGRWHALPDREDLEGKQLWVVVEHEDYHAQDKDTKEKRFNDDGTPLVRQSARITAYAPANGPKPEFKSTLKPGNFPNREEYLAKNPSAGGGFGGGGFGGGAGGQTGDTPW